MLIPQEKLNSKIEDLKFIIPQQILAALEYRGFYDAGKYLDDDFWEKIEPQLHSFLSWYNKELIEEIEEMEKDHAFKVYKVEDIAKESYNQALFDIISKLKE